MSVEDKKITINGKEYELSPLRLKYVKQITTLIGQPAPTKVTESLGRWLPFLGASIREKHPEFKDEEFEEATIPELNAAPDVLLAASGIVIVNKAAGEPMPTADSTGPSSTAA